MKISTKRGLVVGAVFISVLIGLIVHTGTGTLSALGYGDIALICPVGQLETLCASKGFALHPLLLLGAVVIIALLVGKAFCSWLCPVSYIRNFFTYRAKSKRKVDGCDASGDDAGVSMVSDDGVDASSASGDDAGASCVEPLPAVGGKRDGLQIDSRHVVLGGALLSSFAFGFPVFCLVCPVGLTFAVFIGIWNLFRFNEASWGLIIFPLLLVLELVVFRKWCSRICPIAALLSLIASKNVTLKPHVAKTSCLRAQGVDCHTCVEICPEEVDPHSLNIPECSKCGLCADACPAHAITFPLIAAKNDRQVKTEPENTACAESSKN